ncbi:transposase [Myxococcaceae bacterium GXIMD 01537]
MCRSAEVYTAQPPEEVGTEKSDESASATTGLLKYGTGLPFHRIEKLQEGLGVPLPASTQWELVKDAAEKLQPAFEQLIDEAAQAEVLHNDDTTMKVLDLSKQQLQAAAAHAEDAEQERTGVYTSGLIATQGERPIALFLTGRQHAGETSRTCSSAGLRRCGRRCRCPTRWRPTLRATSSPSSPTASATPGVASWTSSTTSLMSAASSSRRSSRCTARMSQTA